MKKLLCISILTALTAVCAQAEEKKDVKKETADEDKVGFFGIGYQGMNNSFGYHNGISIRFAPQPIGGAIVISQASSNGEDQMAGSTAETTTSVFALQGKFMWSLIERKNSDFYIGGLVGLGYYQTETKNAATGNGEEEDASFMLGFLAGTEFRFTELPEIGFNFEIGYNFEGRNDENKNAAGTTTGDYDTAFGGTYVSFGVNYYF